MAAPIGNDNAAKGTQWRDAIRVALAMRSKSEAKSALVKIAEALIAKAEEGDLAAIKELGDRLDGKASQSVELSGKDGEPIPVTVYLPNNVR
jgi:hypothetical protein